MDVMWYISEQINGFILTSYSRAPLQSKPLANRTVYGYFVLSIFQDKSMALSSSDVIYGTSRYNKVVHTSATELHATGLKTDGGSGAIGPKIIKMALDFWGLGP